MSNDAVLAHIRAAATAEGDMVAQRGSARLGGRGYQVHELSLCHAIAELARSVAGDRNVEIVRVQIGALRQVVPDSLSFSWTLVRDHERMPDAELELDFVAAEVLCRSCHQRSKIASRWSVCCPNCESADVEILRGNEFLVTSLDVS